MGWLMLPENSGNGNNSSVFPVRLFQGYPLFGLPCVDSKVKQVSFLDELSSGTTVDALLASTMTYWSELPNLLFHSLNHFPW
jgi:hypothetical protein